MVAATERGSISIRKVSRVFQNNEGADLTALSGVNLKIKAGEFVTLIGPSGCGKSTLLRLIAGLDQPTSGTVSLDGEVINGTHYSRGLVFQDPTLFPWKNVWDNVASGLDARGILKQQKHEVDAYIDLVGLKGFENVYPHMLSGGMAQRAALARALVNHPKVLLLDEPLGALDAFTRMNLQDEILRIWRERGTTMVLVTHDIDEAIYLSDRVIVMTPRPAEIKEIVNIHLLKPRIRNSKQFFQYRLEILEILQLVPEKI
ncbi:ABC transporter ATP-binding protein [Paenibacillus sp. SYP-B3998]|uniref:ABC transporter ATP-binding protein n=1 Tax=Paenibacillus sp. SYP-B3998 TaxID=2678564 RepID=A0A6G3ZS38_9BACL|nr:ABC transporter ATP-binding protein [Paenibacillus sp. SYP-B3998]NEW04870.1 ABC transporter ATP-binding protein [Paenibacillus sp. SYP-B3998]